ncbi:MAG TPA: AAA family ATPase, partial [Candidatus Sulfotelmatobacter sp.]|nr:AAA family ATPase [Candidatus Sulfotelmatobacter sp.]
FFQRLHMIITVSGPHGTGKSTYAARLADALRIRHVSAGALFRRIAKEKRISLEDLGENALEDPSIDKLVDERTIAEAEKGNLVVDGQLAGWVLKDRSDLRIYLTAPEDVRLERIAKRDKVTAQEARLQTKQRESVQRERYSRHYGFHVEDLSIYHLVLDTSIGSIEDTAKVLVSAAIMVSRAKKAQRKSTKP